LRPDGEIIFLVESTLFCIYTVVLQLIIMHKTTILTAALSLLVILPVTAQLGRVWTDFQSYSVDLQNYLRSNINNVKPLEIQAQGAVTEATGELNIPNPVTASERIGNDIFLNSISSNFENNPLINGSLVSNEINRLIVRSSVMGLLGTNGQIRTKVKLQNTQNGLRNIDAFTDKADEINEDFLSDIENRVNQLGNVAGNVPGIAALLNAANQSSLQLQQIKIQRDQSKIMGENLAQTIQGNQFLQYSNLNLANLSQQMEETNRARRVDTSTEAARLLRNTSQTDLFGRTSQ
jgi:hypothetical protein